MPPGPPSVYRVVLTGAQPDRFYAFTVRSTQQGPEDAPAAETNFWTMTNGDLSDQLSLSLTNLAAYQTISATVRITASDGHTQTVPLRNHGCGADGRAQLTAADGAWTAIGSVGPAPYRVGYSLTIDGSDYSATLAIGDDAALPERPEFTPPLPGP